MHLIQLQIILLVSLCFANLGSTRFIDWKLDGDFDAWELPEDKFIVQHQRRDIEKRTSYKNCEKRCLKEDFNEKGIMSCLERSKEC